MRVHVTALTVNRSHFGEARVVAPFGVVDLDGVPSESEVVEILTDLGLVDEDDVAEGMTATVTVNPENESQWFARALWPENEHVGWELRPSMKAEPVN